MCVCVCVICVCLYVCMCVCVICVYVYVVPSETPAMGGGMISASMGQILIAGGFIRVVEMRQKNHPKNATNTVKNLCRICIYVCVYVCQIGRRRMSYVLCVIVCIISIWCISVYMVYKCVYGV
jgi:hypothetical protein